MDYRRCDDSNAGFEIEAGKIQKLTGLAITWNVLLNNYRSCLPYGIVSHMSAKLLFQDKFIYADGAIREMVIWRLPELDEERPHGLKYSLFYGYPGKCLVRYDNERGKGDHRHDGDQEYPYNFVSVEMMIQDFRTDIEKLRGDHYE